MLAAPRHNVSMSNHHLQIDPDRGMIVVKHLSEAVGDQYKITRLINHSGNGRGIGGQGNNAFAFHGTNGANGLPGHGYPPV